MPSNKAFMFGPIALTNAVANLLNPPTATGGVNAGSSGNYIIIRHIRVVSKVSTSQKVTLYKGLTGGSAAGTEFLFNSTPIPGNQYLDAYGEWRFDTADFLTGNADANTSLTIEGEGEIGVAG